MDRTVVNKAAAEVFGPDLPHTFSASPRPVAYALGGLALLAGAALTGFLLWSRLRSLPEHGCTRNKRD